MFCMSMLATHDIQFEVKKLFKTKYFIYYIITNTGYRNDSRSSYLAPEHEKDLPEIIN